MSTSAAWILLVMSGLVDVAWTVSVRMSEGYTRGGWTLVSLLLLFIFIYGLGRALQYLPIGTAYAVWTGIGAAGSVILGITPFGESVSPARLFWIGVVLAGILGLKMASP